MIGYYVHHHGAGHLTRARVISSQLRLTGNQVVLLGSDLGSSAGVVLPRDNDGDLPFVDPDAAGAMHWAPLRHPGYTERMQALAAWVIAHRPRVVVVDVSVEVVALLRLLGVPTVVLAQPGVRTDQAHTLAYRCATAILAPWPAEARPCPAIQAFADKVTYTGGISRVAYRREPRTLGVVLGGQGGSGTRGLAMHLRDQVPGVQWFQAGASQWVDDIAALLARTQIVVTHCGQNAIADIAASNVPAVVQPQPRPHDEQVHLGDELTRLGLAVASPESNANRRRPATGDSPKDWAQAVEAAMAMPGQWHRWGTDAAARRAAELIEQVADG